jgi:uncharacterized membrane protein
MSDSFISKISQKEFPNSDMVPPGTIRKSLMELIQKDYPDFNSKDLISVMELNYYREKYISECLTREIGEIGELEKQVVSSLSDSRTFTSQLEENTNDNMTVGQRVADKVASFGGSWTFIISFGTFLFLWIVLNVVLLTTKAFDPYPFILLNLILSCVAALQAPVIMMSQNRQEEKDRERAKKDYMINLKSELEIRILHEKIDHLIMHQQQELLEIQKVQIEMMNELMEKVNKK